MKRPPEFSWQDKALLISLPIVVLSIFILTNYFSRDPSIDDAFNGQFKGISVRDGGRIIQVYDQTATDSVRFKMKTLSGLRDFDFIYILSASETMRPELGGIIQFYGQYNYDSKGGVVTVPYKGKSGQNEGWLVYGRKRYSGPHVKTQTQTQTQTQNSNTPATN